MQALMLCTSVYVVVGIGGYAAFRTRYAWPCSSQAFSAPFAANFTTCDACPMLSCLHAHLDMASCMGITEHLTGDSHASMYG